MDTLPIRIDRDKAKELYRAYLTHQNYAKPIDEEIKRAYRHIAQGRVIIQALESIRLSGLDALGFPKLALARADQKTQHVAMRADGSATMSPQRWRSSRSKLKPTAFEFARDTFPRRSNLYGEAIVPLIPIHQRPKRGLENYHVLWEADWKMAVPIDPMLLRRLGRGDLWLVLAQWDLTEVERAALSTRVNAA